METPHEAMSHTLDWLVRVPLWQKDFWPPAQHFVAPREQQSSSAGIFGTPTMGDTQQICTFEMLQIDHTNRITHRRASESEKQETECTDTKRYFSVQTLSQAVTV